MDSVPLVKRRLRATRASMCRTSRVLQQLKHPTGRGCPEKPLSWLSSTHPGPRRPRPLLSDHGHQACQASDLRRASMAINCVVQASCRTSCSTQHMPAWAPPPKSWYAEKPETRSERILKLLAALPHARRLAGCKAPPSCPRPTAHLKSLLLALLEQMLGASGSLKAWGSGPWP